MKMTDKPDPRITRRTFCNRALLTSAGVMISATVVSSQKNQQQTLLAYPPMKIDGKMQPVRAFVKVARFDKDGRNLESPMMAGGGRVEGGYRPIGDVLDNKTLRLQYLRQALRELQAWEQRYALFKELATIRIAAARLYSKYALDD